MTSYTYDTRGNKVKLTAAPIMKDRSMHDRSVTKESSASAYQQHQCPPTTKATSYSSAKKMEETKWPPNGFRVSDLNGICANIEAAIRTRLELEKKIVLSSLKFRAQVHADVGEVMKTLRAREIELIKQIDYIEDHHLKTLRENREKSYEMLGQMKHAIRCAEDYINTVASIDLEHLEVASRFANDDYTFGYFSNLHEIQAIVNKFGSLDAPPIIRQSLGLEKDRDKENRLLYETLEKLQLTAKDLMKEVCVVFPELSSNKEDWLLNGGSESMMETTFEPKFVLPRYLLVTDNNSWLKGSDNVAWNDDNDDAPVTWLHHRHHEKPCQSAENDYQSSCTSESIEMVSTSDSTESDGFTCLHDPINLIRSCRESWLIQTKQQKGATNYERKTNCEATMDIENLGDKESWLLVNRGGTNLQISDVCRANETCRAFSDCVCDVSCQERAQKWVDTIEVSKSSNKSKSQASWDGMAWLKNPMTEVTASQLKNNDTWLKRDEGEKMDVSEKQDISNDTETRWVTKESVHRFFVNDRRYNWLKNCLADDTKCEIPNDFKVYFQNTDTKQWLIS